MPEKLRGRGPRCAAFGAAGEQRIRKTAAGKHEKQINAARPDIADCHG